MIVDVHRAPEKLDLQCDDAGADPNHGEDAAKDGGHLFFLGAAGEQEAE